MDFNFPSAFAPFYADRAAVTGHRRETGATRGLALTVPCCVLGGDPANPDDSATAPTSQRVYTLIIRKADWPDHLPPQIGDTIRIEGHPQMAISSDAHLTSDGWTCECRSNDGAPPC